MGLDELSVVCRRCKALKIARVPSKPEVYPPFPSDGDPRIELFNLMSSILRERSAMIEESRKEGRTAWAERMNDNMQQVTITIRMSPATFEAFDALRMKLSDQTGGELSRNALGRSLIEKQLVLHGTLHSGEEIRNRKLRRSKTQIHLEALEAEMITLRNKLDAPVNQQTGEAPFFL